MTLESDLADKIQNELGAVASGNLSSMSAGADLYEAYVWALILCAARREGATVSFHKSDGAPATVFRFRTSPSSLSSTLHDYCHAEIRFPECPVLEAHVGIYVSGRSRVSHECDVAVIYKSEADLCRSKGVDPRSGKLVLSVECKYYISSQVGLGLGRSFLGLLHDIYNGDRFFVSTRQSDNVSRLFAKHNKLYETGVSPLEPDLETRLRHSFELCFRDFVSSERRN